MLTVSFAELLVVNQTQTTNVQSNTVVDKAKSVVVAAHKMNADIAAVKAKRNNTDRKKFFVRKSTRDSLITQLVCDKTLTLTQRMDMRERVMRLNSMIRPANGYPAAPYSRPEYGAGLLSGPKGGMTVAHVQAEKDRLQTYFDKKLGAERDFYMSRAASNIQAHLDRLDMRMNVMQSRKPHTAYAGQNVTQGQTCMRKTPGHKTYETFNIRLGL